MPFALLPSLLSLIIIHLPPATLSCDVLSLSVSLPPISLSLSLTPPPSPPPRTYNTQHSHSLFLFFCLDFRPHTLFPFPVSLSLSLYIYIYLFRSNAYVLLPWERTSAPRGKEGELGSWVGSGLAKGKKERKERESNGALTVWDC